MSREEIIHFLRGEDTEQLFARSRILRSSNFGTKIYLRGLIELSNICHCDCLYCGIRASNTSVERYSLNLEDVEMAAKWCYESGWYSIVLQSGELTSSVFIEKIREAIRIIKEVSHGKISITLSCGEQSPEVYRKWREAGADRYLLRIESSNKELFDKIHPSSISYSKRKATLNTLPPLGYQTGTGVMIGLPGQTLEDLADDLLFLSQKQFVMCGMGPYIEHSDTPLSATPSLYSKAERVELTLRMIALLRTLRPNINIASSTALGTLSPSARVEAMEIGANVIMPNITPQELRGSYCLYEGKITDLDLEIFKESGYEIAYYESGDSPAHSLPNI